MRRPSQAVLRQAFRVIGIQMDYDAIIIGLGAMGSATALHLARRGARVLGVDRCTPPHGFGSSHGETRITREATGEGAAYVPLVRRSHA